MNPVPAVHYIFFLPRQKRRDKKKDIASIRANGLIIFPLGNKKRSHNCDHDSFFVVYNLKPQFLRYQSAKKTSVHLCVILMSNSFKTSFPSLPVC
jgi:hypothetical protein